MNAFSPESKSRFNSEEEEDGFTLLVKGVERKKVAIKKKRKTV